MSTYASAAGENAAANGIAAVCEYQTLNNGSPATTGANEISGGTYARQASAFSTASAGSAPTSGSLTWNVPASTTVDHTGWLTASTGGTYEFGAPLSASVTFNGAGTYTIGAGGSTISATG